MAMPAVAAASRMRLTIWRCGSRRAPVMIWHLPVSGPACLAGVRPCPTRLWWPVSIRPARGGAAAGAVLHEPGGLRLVGVAGGAGVAAQFCLECRSDLAGADEADQGPGQGRWLRPAGDVAHGAAAFTGSPCPARLAICGRHARGCSVPGGVARELLQVVAGDEPASADLDAGQVAAANLVIQQVAGQAGQAGGIVGGAAQPPGGRVRQA